MTGERPLAGLFVGGRARRMHGLAKGLLHHPHTGQPLVVRLAHLCSALGYEPVLVGRAEAYTGALPELRVIDDDPPGIGPIGGLNALLQAAGHRPALALACDLPYVSEALLRRLSAESSDAPVLAARNAHAFWEPLCARYAPEVSQACSAAIAEGVRSFQALFASLQVKELALSPSELDQLRDWDTPEDVGQ